MPNRRLMLAVVPLLAAPVGSTVWMSTAAAASCRVMTVRYDLSQNGPVVLDPNHYDIPYGGCVQFVNQTAATATITVGSHYHQQLGPNENTSGATNYKGTSAGRQTVTANDGPAGSAHGSITVAAAPTPSRSRSPKPSKPSHSAQPAPPPSPTTSSGTGPQVAPTPSGHKPRHGHHRSGGLQPPVPPAGPIQTPPPTATPAPAATTVVSGPVEPASGRGTGLPAALAALAVVGSGAAFVRVLAAEPVDGGEIVGGRL